MKIAGIVFDKDGTLLDIQAFWGGLIFHAASRILQEHGEAENPQELLDELLRAAGMDAEGKILPESLIAAGTNEEIVRAWERVLAGRGIPPRGDFAAHARELLNDGRRCGTVRGPDGLTELLSRLSGRGLLLAVATSDDSEQTEYCLKKLGVREFFRPVLTADRVGRAKPAPDMLWEISRQWRVPPGRILMVGDSVNDMRFAANSGAPGAYLNAADGPLPRGAAGRLSALADLPAFLRELEAAV